MSGISIVRSRPEAVHEVVIRARRREFSGAGTSDKNGKGNGIAENILYPCREAAVSELKKAGFDKVFLWVPEENHRARHFYEKNGFIRTERFMVSNIGGKEVREVQYIN